MLEGGDHSGDEDEKPLSAEQRKIVAKVRWLMLVSGFATVLGIAVVIGVVAYRFYGIGSGPTATADVFASLPRGAKITGTAIAEGRLAVTVELAGAIEVRTFDLKTLKPAGRLRFVTEP